MNDNRFTPVLLYIKAHGTFDTVEVIVESGFGIDKQRRGNAFEVEGKAKTLFKTALQEPDRGLRLVKVEFAFLAFGNISLGHMYTTSLSKNIIYYRTSASYCQLFMLQKNTPRHDWSRRIKQDYFVIAVAADMIPNLPDSKVRPPCMYTWNGSRSGASAESSIDEPCVNAPAAMIISSS